MSWIQALQIGPREWVIARLEDRSDLLEEARHIWLDKLALVVPDEAGHRGASQMEGTVARAVDPLPGLLLGRRVRAGRRGTQQRPSASVGRIAPLLGRQAFVGCGQSVGDGLDR